MVGKNKEAVKIDDWHNDIRGTLIGWVDATDECPADFNGVGKRVVYAPHSDSSKSLLKKLTAPVAKFLFDAFDDPSGFKVSNSIYPKSAIDGYPNGMTVNGMDMSEEGTPDKRVILKNTVEGDRSYMEQVGPGSQGNKQKVSELKDRINELEMALQAEEGKSHELEQEVDREEGKSKRRRTGWGPEDYDMRENAGDTEW